MKNYYIYDDTTGRIKRTGSCPDDQLDIQVAGSNEILVVGIADHANQYVLDGILVSKPSRPSGFHDFDFTSKSWVLNSANAWEFVRSDRDRRLKDTDWMVTKAVELGEPMQPGWATYRQALRDITIQQDPLSIVWPSQP